MADISSLGDLRPVDMLDTTDTGYVDNREFTPIPEAGRWLVVVDMNRS